MVATLWSICAAMVPSTLLRRPLAMPFPTVSDSMSAEPVELKMTLQTSFLAASASSLMVSLVRRVMPSFCMMASDEQPAVIPDQEEPFMERAWVEGAKSREMEHIERWSEV